MVVNDLDIMGITFAPSKTDAPLIVDPDAMLTCPIATQLFQVIARWGAQILQGISCIQYSELPEHRALQAARKPTGGFACEEAFRIPVREAPNHGV